MKPQNNLKNKSKLKGLDKQLSELAREVELLYLIMEHKDLSDYNLDSDLASARFQLENLASNLANVNNEVLMNILKHKQAT